MNRENIIQLIQKKDWVSLIEKFKDDSTYKLIQSDPILNNIIQNNFVPELVTGNSFSEDSAYSYYLEQFFVLHEGKYNFKLDQENYEKLIVKLVDENYKSNNLRLSFNYATKFPDNETCKNIIKEFESQQEKIISHTQSHKITLKENSDISEADHTSSLFKSRQEYIFYKAVREVFPTYMVFPNVAFNAVINFEAIKKNLTNQERQFYFMGLIDCVVIDQENNYKPVQFIELDSYTHDNERQIKNDEMKDKIVGLAGHRLFRIRGINKAIDEGEFKKLIREVIKT